MINYNKVEGGRTVEISAILSFANVDQDIQKVDMEVEFFGSTAKCPVWVG